MKPPLAIRTPIPVAEPVLDGRELEYVTDAIRSGWISSLGSYVTAFESALASIADAEHAVAVSNGTAALHLGLVALGVGPGDEVIVPSFTFVATAAAVRYVGATPVFAEVDALHWCLDPPEIARLVTERTRAVIPVHVYGHPCDMDAIREQADMHGLAVVEDAAEAIGARCRNRSVGAIGDVGVFSFYGNKLITTGEGGALVTNDAAVADRLRVLRDHAMDPERRYWHTELAFNYRITNVQAAIGVAQLERFDELLARKREIADRYREGLEDVPRLRLQEQARWAESAWWMFTVRVLEEDGLDRDRLADLLALAGIDSRPAFPPVHEMPPYLTDVRLPVTAALARDGLTLPSGAGLTETEQEHVIAAVRDICGA